MAATPSRCMVGAILLGAVLALNGCASWFAREEPAPPRAAEVVTPPPAVAPEAPAAPAAPAPAPPAVPPPAPSPPPAPAAVPGPAPLPSLEGVFFAFDRADLSAEAKASVDRNAAALRANPGAAVVVEGHCDERGTNQYNLALGERRAKVVRDYLVAAGIGASRITTISYGEERPFVLGHDEPAWRWNRRAHLVPKGS